jgi:hypothetical protein
MFYLQNMSHEPQNILDSGKEKCLSLNLTLSVHGLSLIQLLHLVWEVLNMRKEICYEDQIVTFVGMAEYFNVLLPVIYNSNGEDVNKKYNYFNF